MRVTKRVLALLLGLSLATGPAALAAEPSGAAEQAEVSVSAPAEPEGACAPESEAEPVPEVEPESEPKESPEDEDPARAPGPEEPEAEAEEAEPSGVQDDGAQELQPQEGEESALAEEDPADWLEEEPYEPEKNDPNYFSPVVTLQEGEDYGYENFYALSSALSRADGEHPLTVRVEAPGHYQVSSGGRALMLKSLTTLDLNGATLIRAGGMYNLMQNESLEGERSVAGYTATQNVSVKNGTLDGGGNSMPGLNLVNLGHAQGLRFENLTFLHGQGSHLLELNGCKDCVIRGCTFDGYDLAGGKNLLEAIQLDISYNGAGESWNGVYCEEGTPGCDNTVCDNILVENCQFQDYPSGVGNHHCLYGGPRSRKIVIRNNRFTNSVDWGKVNDYEPPAVWCYGLENSEVSGNTITGVYRCGVRFSGGSVKVKKNTIGSKSKPVSYPPIYVTEANSYVKGEKSTRKAESVTGGCVDGNTVYTTYSKGNNAAVTVYGRSTLSSISGNRLFSTKRSGIVIGVGSTVKNVNKNTITGPGKTGIYITQSTVTNVNQNTVKNAKKNGIEVTGSGKVTAVKSNTVSGCKGVGIRIVNRKLKVTVQKNKLSGNKKDLQVTAKGSIQKAGKTKKK